MIGLAREDERGDAKRVDHAERRVNTAIDYVQKCYASFEGPLAEIEQERLKGNMVRWMCLPCIDVYLLFHTSPHTARYDGVTAWLRRSAG